jgi:hypothetical protein
MQLTPVSTTYDLGSDLLLADGSIIYKDGLSRWVREAPDGTERVLSYPVVAPKPVDRDWACNCDHCLEHRH